MPFIPHTKADVQAMLSAIGADSIEELFDEIPASLRISGLSEVPVGVREQELAIEMRHRALKDIGVNCFIGAGAYEHHIPAAVWEVATRGEFMTSYTPYQAEASQGTLQLIYEYQTMMATLMGMDVSNASVYDGATGLAEAILMSIRLDKKATPHRILIPQTLHPYYRQVVKTLVVQPGVELIEIPYSPTAGKITLEQLQTYQHQPFTSMVIAQPNFFGVIEEVDLLTNWAHERGGLVIGCVNPLAMSLLKEPGLWGEKGADIVCGEGQSLGIPLASGGPYYGFLCCKQSYIRQMPGRIVGRTVDLEGKQGFTLTLQAREQHIRRDKATSNICTNQGLAVTASTIHMSILGAEGLRQVAIQSHGNTNALINKLTQIEGVQLVFSSPTFHEAVLRLPKSAEFVLSELTKEGILGGFPLGADYPELADCIVLCVTETKSEKDLDTYLEKLKKILMLN